MITWNQGMAQQTMAVQQLYRKASGAVRARTSKRRKTATAKRAKKSASATKRSKPRATSKASKFVKGSAAAKRHMAKLRKMVGRK